MINPKDVAKALRLIAEEIESKGYDVIINESLSYHIDGVRIAAITIANTLYKVELQFKTDDSEIIPETVLQDRSPGLWSRTFFIDRLQQ